MREIISVTRQLKRAPRLDRYGTMRHTLIAVAGAAVGIIVTIPGATLVILILLARG